MCGSRNLFEQMLRAYALAETRSPGSLVPVIDRVFGFREVREAFELLRSQDFFGKIVIDVAGEGLGTEGR